MINIKIFVVVIFIFLGFKKYFKNPYNLIYFGLSIFILNILDVYTTFTGLYIIEGFYEANPFMRYLFNNIGFFYASFLKMVVAGIIAIGYYKFVIYLYKRQYLNMISIYINYITFMYINLFYLFIVTKNVIYLVKA